MYHCQLLIGSCTRKIVGNGFGRKTQILIIDWYCNNYNQHINTWIGTHEECNDIDWSDECSVEMSNRGQQLWIFWQPPKIWCENYTVQKLKGQGLSLMVWSHLRGRNCGRFCPLIFKSVHNGVNIQRLGNVLLPVLKWIQDTLGNSMLPLDNAPVLQTGLVVDHFDTYNILADDYLPCSPALNPIAIIWVEHKYRFNRTFVDNEDTKQLKVQIGLQPGWVKSYPWAGRRYCRDTIIVSGKACAIEQLRSLIIQDGIQFTSM